MAIDEATRTRLEDNIALSRTHIVKQEIIISNLIEQGHDSMVVVAKKILSSMHIHLNTEIEMLRVLTTI